MYYVSPKSLHSPSSSSEFLTLSSHLKRANPHLFNDAILPEQFYSELTRFSRLSAEAALMRAVLDDALNCFQRGRHTQDARTRRIAQEAEAWLFSDDEECVFSFLNICAVLGLDPTMLRTTLRHMPRHAVRQPQHKKYVATRLPRRLHIAA
jgi:hypothetical protein